MFKHILENILLIFAPYIGVLILIAACKLFGAFSKGDKNGTRL